MREQQALIKLSKRDLIVLLVVTALVPVLSFGSGQFMASVLSDKPLSTKVELMPEAVKAEPVKEIVINSDNNLNVPVAPMSPITAEPEGYYLIQAGMFSSFDNAKRYHQELTDNKIAAEIIDSDNHTAHRVILNKFKSKETAIRALAAYKDKYSVSLYLSFIPEPNMVEVIAAI